MKRSESMLIEALNASVRKSPIFWSAEIAQNDWQEFFALSHQQHIFPLVLNSIHSCDAFLALPESMRKHLKQNATHQVIGQTMRTQALKQLAKAAAEQNLQFIVMKGACCRTLYPNPDARPSSDEDLLVPDGQFAYWVDFLLSLGYHPDKNSYDVAKDFEIGFRTANSYLELHKTPFAPDSDLLSGFNPFFATAYDRKQDLNIEGTVLPAMGPYDHMLYLILHAFKHLIHSGFGLRQICDIILWAEQYGTDIDWLQLKTRCDNIRCWGFAATVFEIGRRYFELDLHAAHIPSELLWENAPCEALLKDLLNGGVYGGTDLGRKHSSTITLQAVESAHSGKKSSLLQTLFPPRNHLEGAYPYLRRFPLLLPVAWIQRIVRYGSESAKTDASNRPSESIRIGRERKELLRKLDILD